MNVHRNRPIEPRYDTIVVGARCAGAATAMLLARQGQRVLLIDRAPEGTDTVSTHALMRGAVVQLHRWGLLHEVEAAGTPAIRNTTFHYGDETVPLRIKPRFGVDALYAPRRTVLDPILVEAAREAGVTVRYGTRLEGLLHDRHGRVQGVLVTMDDAERGLGETHPYLAIRADMVVGADGRKSTVARHAGAATSLRGQHASSVIYGYFTDIGSDAYHWYFGEREADDRALAAGMIPTNDGAANVFLALPAARLERARADLEGSFFAMLERCAPQLVPSLRSKERVGRLWSFVGRRGFMRQAWGRGWALVGDAGYFKDPLTAHGITDALRDAELLARGISLGTEHGLMQYQLVRDHLSRQIFEISDQFGSLDWDLPTAKDLHLQLHHQMQAETEYLTSFDDAQPSAA
jgi:flavin-dependent dehydrogenase